MPNIPAASVVSQVVMMTVNMMLFPLWFKCLDAVASGHANHGCCEGGEEESYDCGDHDGVSFCVKLKRLDAVRCRNAKNASC
jgi:hypothetical protein